MNIQQLIIDAQEKLGIFGEILVVVAAVAIALIIHRILFGGLRRWSHRTDSVLVQLLDKYLHGPTQSIFALIALSVVFPVLDLPFEPALTHIFTISFIGAVAYLLIRAIRMMRELATLRYNVKSDDNLHARKAYTQFKVIEQILVFLIVIFAISVALMTFSEIRQIGVSLLASAGIAGIIVGFAAQKSLTTLLAGVQIAISQPIRIDDVVVVEGEWGRIEEITLTYVVIKLWDERRLVVPITYFIDKPFQSWTRTSAELIGSVFIYADYRTPVEAMRQELNRFLASQPLWDKRVSALQITNASERTMEIRVLVSASNAGKVFDLRCAVRERLIAFLQEHYPDSLPRTRIEVDSLVGRKPDGLVSELVHAQPASSQ